MKRSLLKLSAFAVLAGTSQVVLATGVNSYNVSWAAYQALPFSPWLSVLIGLMLLLATYAFIRRHAGQGLFMLATATFIGGLALHTDKVANAFVPTYYSITTPNGTVNPFICFSPNTGFQNNTSNQVTLTVTSLNSSPIITSPGYCFTGVQLSANGGSCELPCTAPV